MAEEEFYQWLQLILKSLKSPVWLLEDQISRKDALLLIANFFGLDPEDPELLVKASSKLEEYLSGKLEPISIPPNIEELVRDYEEHLKKEKEALLKRAYPKVDEQIRAWQQQYAASFQELLKEIEEDLPEEEKVLTQNKIVAEVISDKVAGEIAFLLPQTTRLEGDAALSETVYQQAFKKVQPKINQSLERIGIRFPERTSKTFFEKVAKRTLKAARVVAAAPRTLVKEVPPPRKKISPEELILPKQIADKLAEKPEGVAFVSVYTALQPQITTSLVQKVISAPSMVILKAAASEATPEWQEMIEKGIFVEDIEATIKKYKEAGLPEDHPIIQSLENKKARFLEQQKEKIVIDGKVIHRDKPATRILKRYYLYDKQTGRLELVDKETGLPLQTSPAPVWSKEKGYSWQLRQLLNTTGITTRLFESVEITPGRSVIQFTLPSKIVKRITFGRFESFGAIRAIIYQKTIGRAISYVGKKLAKTAFGKAVKEGLKKAATWVATKLGVEAGIVAAGTAVAPVVGTAIGLAISTAIEIGGKILGKIWDQVKLTIKEPERFLAALGAAAVAAIVLPAPFSLVVAAPFAILGSLGAISWGVGSAGAIAGGFATQVTTFFVVLATAPITAPIALLVILILGLLATTTFFIVMTTAGAFILPVGPTEMIEEVPPPPAPPDIPPPPGLTFRWPVDSPYTCSSNYGYRTLTIRGMTTCDYHEGIDIPAPAGTPVYSTAEGEVISLGSNSGYGTYIVVKHDGVYSFYAHLLATATYVGVKVDQSSVIGYVDNTGYSTGTHLHFGFSSCSSVPGCFNNGSLTPNPCGYVSCPSNCEYRDRATGCPGL